MGHWGHASGKYISHWPCSSALLSGQHEVISILPSCLSSLEVLAWSQPPNDRTLRTYKPNFTLWIFVVVVCFLIFGFCFFPSNTKLTVQYRKIYFSHGTFWGEQGRYTGSWKWVERKEWIWMEASAFTLISGWGWERVLTSSLKLAQHKLLYYQKRSPDRIFNTFPDTRQIIEIGEMRHKNCSQSNIKNDVKYFIAIYFWYLINNLNNVGLI